MRSDRFSSTIAAIRERGDSLGKLINIDNGGTLTDIVVVEGDRVHCTKTLTTPYDLSKCFFDGLKKVSVEIYGSENVVELLRSTDFIRYSTTQGTNALVERKGPRLGLVMAHDLPLTALRASGAGQDLFASMFGERIVTLDARMSDVVLEDAVVAAVNRLTSAGANRLVVGMAGAGYREAEQRLMRIVLRKFPLHLLGAVPVLFSHQVVEDIDDARRIWSAAFNAFLHPAMETFLYHAERLLRSHHYRKPLLIFRNDGDSARVAKTIALKTYSSGPRGGMEGARALAAFYGFERLLSLDVGGTTTDIGLAEQGRIRELRRGAVEGVDISYPLVDVVSHGVGGGSVIRAEAGRVLVGPESVGAQPGPACFGMGGKLATITDVTLLTGVLDAQSFFGGGLVLDVERARAAVLANIAKPLDCSVDAALARMQAAWVARVADGIRAHTTVDAQTTLAAFGGGGPLNICAIAEAVGVQRVIVPRLAAVFSAFGLGFSDIAHHHEAVLPANTQAALDETLATLRERARRDMFAEGFALDACVSETTLTRVPEHGGGDVALDFDGARLPSSAQGRIVVSLRTTAPIEQARLAPAQACAEHAAKIAGARNLLLETGRRQNVPLLRVEGNQPGAHGMGPAIIEEAYFTCRVLEGWSFRFTGSHDLILESKSPRGVR